MDLVAAWLDIPRSKSSEIESTHRNIADRRRELSTYYITQHPTPTWLQVANAMWRMQVDTGLSKVNSLYFRGKTCTHVLCITSSSLVSMATN